MENGLYREIRAGGIGGDLAMIDIGNCMLFPSSDMKRIWIIATSLFYVLVVVKGLLPFSEICCSRGTEEWEKKRIKCNKD